MFSRGSRARRSIFVVALFVLITLAGCGSKSSQETVRSLPPAIPAAEPVLLFNGTGSSPNDVKAIRTVLSNLGIGYTTADSTQLNNLSEAEMAGYKLIIVPGGNSIEIGQSLTASTASALRGAVTLYGTHYLGVCAGAFFGGSSIYNGLNLTGGVSFDFYVDESRGIHIEPVEITRPNDVPIDVYWEDGPQLSGWGQVVARFPDGTPAIVQGQSGKGFVVFTGVHLEAPEDWRGSMNFKTPVPVDLEYAGTVFQAALKGTVLPHF
ncbi:MAG: hypothetical protein DMG80_02095 [Acidobacteria bacterium]|nr:MAG: hypothetical protein DMG80_02095 [Acidobacteriota bacterium]